MLMTKPTTPPSRRGLSRRQLLKAAGGTAALLAAANVVETDHKVDAMEREIDEQAIALLALRQPMASDLRTVVSALRIAGDVERHLFDSSEPNGRGRTRRVNAIKRAIAGRFRRHGING